MSDFLAKFVDLIYADDAADTGQGLESSLTHTWPLPIWVTCLLIGAAAGYVIAIYVREQGQAGRVLRTVLAGLRISLISLVVCLMYGWLRHQHRTELPDLVVLLDVSRSMTLQDLYEDEEIQKRPTPRGGLKLTGSTRLNLAKALLLEPEGGCLGPLLQRYNVKFYQVGASAQPLAAGANGLASAIAATEASDDSSRLGTCLREVLELQRGRPTAGVVILSDGVTTSGKSLSEASEYARRRNLPLFTIGIGSDRSPRDLRLTDLVADEFVFLNDLVSFDFKLTGSGYAGRSVQVRLREKGATTTLAEVTQTLGADGQSQPASLSFRPAAEGEFEYVIEVETQAGEVDSNNNRLTQRVTVRDQTIRVLLVQDYPSFEWRFLKMLLGRVVQRTAASAGKSVELTSVLHEADEHYAGQDETAQWVFPVRRDELFQYDVVVYGDVDPRHLNESVLQNIAAFVTERGGGLVFLAGPRYLPLAYRETPLARLMPINLDTVRVPDPEVVLDEATEFRAQLTPLGLATPHLQLAETPESNREVWQEFPPLRWLLEAPDVQPAARVLAVHPTRSGATGENLPLVILQQVGAGKVLFHATDESYRWARHPGGEQYYARYWLQTLRYLAHSKLLGPSRGIELSTDREEYRYGEPARLVVRFLDERLAPTGDDGVAVMLEHQAGRRRQVVLTRAVGTRAIYGATVDNLPEGTYRMWLARPALDAAPPPRQFTVVAPATETTRLLMDAADLQLAANATGGQFYTLETAGRLLADLPAGRQVRIESLPPQPIWNSWLSAGLFVALIVAEWLLRKRAGWL